MRAISSSASGQQRAPMGGRAPTGRARAAAPVARLPGGALGSLGAAARGSGGSAGRGAGGGRGGGGGGGGGGGRAGIARRRIPDIGILNGPAGFTFGVELELVFPAGVSLDDVRGRLERVTFRGQPWKLKLDGSIGCQRQDASCVQAEVVSPILWGPSGLESVFDAVGAIKPLRPSVNRSTGMHVHVKARDAWALPALKTLAHNAVVLESGLDAVTVASRRANNNTYCKSLRGATREACASAAGFRPVLGAIADAGSAQAIIAAVNPEGRHYKVNFHALERHGTVEFRFRPGSQNAAKIAGYVLLCLNLCDNATRARKARIVQPGAAFENLARFAGAGDPVLAGWLHRRRGELAGRRAGARAGGCGCGGGAHGGDGGCGCGGAGRGGGGPINVAPRGARAAHQAAGRRV